MTRTVHIVGTAVAVACVALSVLTLEPALLVVGVLVAYAAAWISHALIESNAPKTFSHPAWSLRADLRMLRLAIAGKLREEMAKHGAE